MRLRSAVLVVLLVTFSVWSASKGCAKQLPVELGVAVSHALRSLYEGQYEAALSFCEEAKDILGDGETRKELAAKKIHWQLIECRLRCIEAVAYAEQGKFKPARASIEQAARVKAKTKQDEAWISVSKGDFEFAQSCALVPSGHLDAQLKSLLQARADHLNRAETLYDQARKTMADYDLAFSGDDGYRLAARVNAGLGRVQSARAASMGEGSKNLFAKANRFFENAESELRNTDGYSDIISPDAKWPLTLRELQKKLASAKVGSASRDELHARYSKVILEWARLQCDRAELKAREAAFDRQDDEALAQAEAFYQKAKDMCVEHFGPRHPSNFRIDVSRASFYLGRAKAMRELAKKASDQGDQERTQAAAKSYFLDVIFLVDTLLESMREALDEQHPLRVDALLLELAALDDGQAVEGRKRGEIVEEIGRLLALQGK